MPSTTPRLGLPYLLPGDPPDLAGSTQSLATAVETYLLGPAWITLTLAAGVQATAAAGTTSGAYIPQYRVWANGRVEYRGSVQRTSGTAFNSAATLFSIPAAAMPAAIVRSPVTGTVNAGVTENTRLEFTPTDGLCTLWANTGDYFFLSLDAAFYYTT